MGPSEHLGAKINNPIAAVSGCPQALDSLNYLSVVSRRGQGCLPLSVCLRAETNERVSSIAPPTPDPPPHHSTIVHLVPPSTRIAPQLHGLFRDVSPLSSGKSSLEFGPHIFFFLSSIFTALLPQ